ncbi:hypothetical protein OAT67_09480 [Bacteriovoracaceae bacterium]|nr:hypothetical protein [Bacteriovoracaceae bacterium]
MYKKTFINLCLIFSTLSISVLEINLKNCSEASDKDPVLYSDDFKWGETKAEILAREKKLYNSNKRLEKRAYVNNEGEIKLPLNALFGEEKFATVAKKYVESVKAHIEKALKRNYVDSIIFSDMGHQHFFIPQKFYDEELSKIPVKDKDLLYEKMLAHSELKILYHTAEQMKMVDENKKILDDRHTQWRFYTRNIVGDNKGLGTIDLVHQPDHSHNTSHSYEKGYKYLGAGLYLSANKNGCFAYDHLGEKRYFDINIVGLNPSGNSGDTDYF